MTSGYVEYCQGGNLTLTLVASPNKRRLSLIAAVGRDSGRLVRLVVVLEERIIHSLFSRYNKM